MSIEKKSLFSKKVTPTSKNHKTATEEILSLVAHAPRLKCARLGKIWQSKVDNMNAAQIHN
jgi:hypothetical protein